VINGGFGLLLDGSESCDGRIRSMLSWDVNNGVARRAWARNPNAVWTAQAAMAADPALRITLPHPADDALVNEAAAAGADRAAEGR
jgi:urocanate hydratase